LSDTLYPAMPSWPTLPELRYDAIKQAVRDYYTINVITQMHMHVGSHVDVQLHSIVGGKSLDNYPLDRYMGEGLVLDFRQKGPGEEITPADFREFDSSIREGDVVMLCTDWHKKRGFNPDYLYRWPFPNPGACRHLVERKVKAVGTEAMSIAGWGESVATQGPVTKHSSIEIHNILLEKDIVIIEGLSHLDEVLGRDRSKRAFFVFAPINFAGTEGGPCRAMAFLSDE